jgi:acetone carboxylase gamma subunit
MPDDHEQRECPLCGTMMRLTITQSVTPIPGNRTPSVRPHREWICPDCDNFEEADE